MSNSYKKTIVSMLQGKTPDLRGIPEDRLDWEGIGDVLALYDGTGGSDRDEFIRAMGEIIEEGKQPPPILAQVVNLASNLDISQVEPSVIRLSRKRSLKANDTIQTAVGNYLGYRQLGKRLAQPVVTGGSTSGNHQAPRRTSPVSRRTAASTHRS